MEIIVSASYIGQVSREIGRLRQTGRESEAAALEANLNDLLKQADRISLGMTVGVLSEIARGMPSKVPCPHRSALRATDTQTRSERTAPRPPTIAQEQPTCR